MYIVARERAGELTSTKAERAVRWLKGLRGKISRSVDGASCLRARVLSAAKDDVWRGWLSSAEARVKRVYAASVCGERWRLRCGTCERRMLRNARRSSGSSGHASGGRCRSVASGAVERVGASEASRGEAEPLRKRVTAQRGNERRGTSRFVGCGMGERGGGGAGSSSSPWWRAGPGGVRERRLAPHT